MPGKMSGDSVTSVCVCVCVCVLVVCVVCGVGACGMNAGAYEWRFVLCAFRCVSKINNYLYIYI